MFKSEVEWSAAPSGVCSTCLATDRELLPLDKTLQFVNISIGLALSKDDLVCFECHARLQNIVKFRSRALCAKRMLSENTQVRCLSTLCLSVISSNKTIYMDDESILVKQEMAESSLLIKDVWSEHGIITAEPSKDKSLNVKGSNPEDALTFEPKSELEDNDDGKFESFTDEEVAKPQKEQLNFKVKQIDHSEVLAYLERERSSEQYRRAKYKCAKCAQAFFSRQTMKIHDTLHTDNRRHFKCEVCEQRFKSSPQLKRHSDCHFRQYGCPECEHTDNSYSKMYEHYKSAHGGPSTSHLIRRMGAQARSAQRRTRRFPCGSCAREYKTSYGLQQHHKRKHDVTVPELECGICHKKYKGQFNLRVHLRNVHEPNPGNAYCVECNLQFKHPHQYKQHLNTSRHVPAESYKYECDYCAKRFPQKQTLADHIEEQHLKLAKYACDLCGERFHSKRYAVRHKRRRHSGKLRERSSCVKPQGNPSVDIVPQWPSTQLCW